MLNHIQTKMSLQSKSFGLLKLSRNMKSLNDVTAACLRCLFLNCQLQKIPTEMSPLFRDDFRLSNIKTYLKQNWKSGPHFLPLYCLRYDHLSQNWGSEDHFEMLNGYNFWLVQQLWHKMQIFPFPFFCNFVQKHTFVFFVFLRFVS